MRKSILLVMSMLLCLAVGFTSCNGCKNEPAEPEAAPEVAKLIVENVTNADRQYMFTNYGGDYRWFESCIVLKDFLDEDCDGTVAGISNVFQVVEEQGNGADVFVILAAHTPDTTAYEIKHGFWVEDYTLNNEKIKVTFAQAFEKVNQVNLPKPHSKQCVLRKEIGPVDANPQYIFGNARAQLYVDAVTGDVTDKNPCYPEDKGFKMPLGEWP